VEIFFTMTAATINRLVGYIPDALLDSFCTGGRREFDAFGVRRNSDMMRFVAGYKQVDFGFRFCKLCADHDLGFPAMLDPEDEPLFRCWLYCINSSLYKDEIISQAVAFMTPEMAGMRATLKGVLMAKEATHQNVAAALNLNPMVVRAFEKMFFNVLDRKQDTLYRQELLFMDGSGRLAALSPGYLRSLPVEQALMRAGADNGIADAMYLGGASTKAIDELAATKPGPALERLLLAWGVLLARNGELNQSGHDAPGLMAARQIIAVQKRSGETGDQSMFDLLMSQSLKDEIKANQIPMKFKGDRTTKL
jgi:hypothetical protein